MKDIRVDNGELFIDDVSVLTNKTNSEIAQSPEWKCAAIYNIVARKYDEICSDGINCVTSFGTHKVLEKDVALIGSSMGVAAVALHLGNMVSTDILLVDYSFPSGVISASIAQSLELSTIYYFNRNNLFQAHKRCKDSLGQLSIPLQADYELFGLTSNDFAGI